MRKQNPITLKRLNEEKDLLDKKIKELKELKAYGSDANSSEQHKA